MWASLRTEHGRKGRWGIGGWHYVRREAPVRLHSISVSPWGQIEIRTGYEPQDVWVQFSPDELRMVIETLRARGVEVDPDREKLGALVKEMTEVLESRREKVAEAAD